MIKILIGSPVHQHPDILKEFLVSLEQLDTADLDIHYCFVDDNDNTHSSSKLNEFKANHDNVTILDSSSSTNSSYICDEYTHRWTDDLVEKITAFKNSIIDIAKTQSFDYLFFIDSDIVLHPYTLKKLISDEKDIVSNIFWTQWNPNTEPLPQVWLKDRYTLYNANSNSIITQNEIIQQTREFIDMLKKPGLYKVGGLGACTLISQNALSKGVTFDPVYNISFWGEDRHFCIRAAVLGLQLYVDTYYPAYHIYRQSDLKGVADYKQNFQKRDTEILGSRILDQIVEAIQGVNTYSYKTGIDTKCSRQFTPKEFEKQLERVKSEMPKVEAYKIINRCRVHECTMSFYNDNSMIVTKVKASLEGYKKFYSFYDEYEFTCTLTKQEDQSYLITDLKNERKLPLNTIPIVRKVREVPKLTLSMIVKNEEHRYLKQMLEKCREYIDNAVIIDDNSTDNTIALCKEVLDGIPVKIVTNDKSKFANETTLRKQQWFETIATNPDWILFLDADEIFEDSFKYHIETMLENYDADGYIFRLFDFWDDGHYRDDKLWCAHLTYRPFLIRYQKNFNYKFTETPQHCGRLPENVLELPYLKSNLRLKHYGWAKEEDRITKYNRYMKLDPSGKYGSMDQYISILDPRPNLVLWNEIERM